MAFLPVYIYFIAFSFLVSLVVFFNPQKDYSYLKLFPPFLLVTLITETIGTYIGYYGKNNMAIYNFFTTFEFCFYLWILSVIIRNNVAKKIIRGTLIFYALAATINILFIQKIKVYHTVTYSLGCLLIVGFCTYYFLELFRLPKYVKLQNIPSFWICSGLLFYYSCSFPLFGLINYWYGRGISQLVLNNFGNIVTILNIFLYSLFAISFVCIKTRKYTLSSS